MKLLAKICSHLEKFKKYNKTGGGGIFIYSYLFYCCLRVKYGIGIDEFFNNRLWDSSINHESFYSNLHTYVHKWNYVSKHFSPSNNRLWLLLHRLDYVLAKVYCPGLDAMDYFRYQFYDFLPSKRRSFITEGGVSKMVQQFNGSREGEKMANIFKSKPEFNALFSDIIKRKWIEVKNATEEQFMFF